MLSQYSAVDLEGLIEKMHQHGFCIMDNFVTDATILALASECVTLKEHAQFREASTGRVATTMHNTIRGDSIYWLNANNTSDAQKTYFAKMESLRLCMNQHLYLGLFALESHLAIFPTGSGYNKHLDQFRSNNNDHLPRRQISCILYLNQNWKDADGGHLRLDLNPKNEFNELSMRGIPQLDVSPIGGRLVIFLSDIFYHAVLPASRDRTSLTTWFLTR